MKRKYPAKMFLFFVFTNFLFHFFYLSLPGIALCIVGIWSKPCLWGGLGILLLDLVLSVIEQLRICHAALTSTHPDVRELMDAFCGPGGMEDFGKVLEEKMKASQSAPPDSEQQ